jgi:DNA repair exonuclease SbcCD ATPase subunit
MKKLFFAGLCLLTFAGCQQGNKNAQNQEINQQRDSLKQIIAQKDNEINDMIGTLNDIEEGFREITEAQGRVQVAKRGEGASSAGRIKENMQFIQSTLQQNKELIGKLRQQLRESSVASEQLRRTIENLTSQLEAKSAEIQKLMVELDAKDIHIGELDEQIAGLSDNVSQLVTEGQQKDNTITTQDKELNSAWFVFGTKSELKEQKILSSGEVLRGNFNKDYFTKIDIRVDKEIKLYSRSASILTNHPEGSYTLQRDANKQFVLRITNPQQFWSVSKYLVVLVK